jgi:hypothetical protein
MTSTSQRPAGDKTAPGKSRRWPSARRSYVTRRSASPSG